MSVKLVELDEWIKILPSINKWKETEYRKLFWSGKVPHPSLTSIINSTHFKYSSINRERAIYLIENMCLDTINTITTIISVQDSKINKSILCGFVYSEVSVDNKYYRDLDLKTNNPNHIIYSNNILSKYINIGPSLESVDGEYRSQFTDMNGLYKIKENHKDLHAEIMSYIKKKNSERSYILTYETFFPNTGLKKHELDLDRHFQTHEIGANIYLMTWYVGIYTKLTNIRDEHVNERYLSFMDKYSDEDTTFFKSLIAKYTKETMEIVYRHIQNSSIPGAKNTTILGMGQKLTPLNLLEVQNPFDVRFVPWRDYLVAQALSKLVINNICPGFALINSWMYVKSSKKGLFNNKIQYQKIERSDQARSIIDLLVKSKGFAYQNIKESSIKKMKGTVTHMFEDKFKVLHDQIDEAVNFGKNEIIMSNASFLTVGEYTGRTWNDSVRLAKSSPYYNESIGKPYTSEGYKYFKKYIFDVCYNIHCMFEYFGVVHGDLHLNNLTLYQKFPAYHAGFDKVRNPHVLYTLGEKNEYCFVMPSKSVHATLIDFGRCFIHPDKIELVRDSSIPTRYETTKNKPSFVKEQIYRLVRTYIRAVPSTADQEQELKLLFTKNFNIMYKLMSVLDLYVFLTKLKTLFALKSKDVVTPHSNCIHLIQKILDICSIYLISDVSKLIEDKSYADAIESRRTPTLEIMLKMFSDNIYDGSQEEAVKAYTIIDVFNFTSPMKYSITSLDTMPDVYKINKYIDETDKLVQVSSVGMNIRRDMRLDYEKNRVRNMDTIDLISRRHKEKMF